MGSGSIEIDYFSISESFLSAKITDTSCDVVECVSSLLVLRLFGTFCMSSISVVVVFFRIREVFFGDVCGFGCLLAVGGLGFSFVTFRELVFDVL